MCSSDLEYLLGGGASAAAADTQAHRPSARRGRHARRSAARPAEAQGSARPEGRRAAARAKRGAIPAGRRPGKGLPPGPGRGFGLRSFPPAPTPPAPDRGSRTIDRPSPIKIANRRFIAYICAVLRARNSVRGLPRTGSPQPPPGGGPHPSGRQPLRRLRAAERQEKRRYDPMTLFKRWNNIVGWADRKSVV